MFKILFVKGYFITTCHVEYLPQQPIGEHLGSLLTCFATFFYQPDISCELPEAKASSVRLLLLWQFLKMFL